MVLVLHRILANAARVGLDMTARLQYATLLAYITVIALCLEYARVNEVGREPTVKLQFVPKIVKTAENVLHPIPASVNNLRMSSEILVLEADIRYSSIL
jgi:hypothetical protein